MSSRELKPRLRLGALLVLLMFALAGGRTEASPAAAAADPPAVITLANGLTVIVDERPDALAIGVSLAARAGTRDDRPGRGGEMALLARALLGGTAAYPSVDRLRRPIERTGGDLELEIDPDLTRYTAVVPPGSLAVAVDTLGAMLREPRFGITDLADAVEATAAGRYSPLDDDISAALWPGHPAGRPSGGTEASRDGITYADLLALRARAFAARNLALAVSGPVSAAEVVAMAESATPARAPLARSAPRRPYSWPSQPWDAPPRTTRPCCC
jgi:zinc protease